eukprot:2935839-Rhodomonas_salina.2
MVLRAAYEKHTETASSATSCFAMLSTESRIWYNQLLRAAHAGKAAAGTSGPGGERRRGRRRERGRSKEAEGGGRTRAAITGVFAFARYLRDRPESATQRRVLRAASVRYYVSATGCGVLSERMVLPTVAVWYYVSATGCVVLSEHMVLPVLQRASTHPLPLPLPDGFCAEQRRRGRREGRR